MDLKPADRVCDSYGATEVKVLQSVMAESICRTLRDGALEGELAPALTIKDTAASPFGFDLFSHFLSQLSSFTLAGKSQFRGIVVVAFTQSPSFYVDLLRSRGIDIASPTNWIKILDCYTDPLGWKDNLDNAMEVSHEASVTSHLCKDVRDLVSLYSLIFDLGEGLVEQAKDRFCVAIDSVNEMLRYASVSRVASLLNNLRSHDQVSSMYWLLHSDLHELRVTSVIEYMSSMVASIEPLNRSANGKIWDLENLALSEKDFGKGKLNVRFKRRNGRVRVMYENFEIERSGIKFTSVSSEDGIVNQGLMPKVQFNLELSEKEQMERAKVVLPFEHQGNGKPIEIYDGRRSLTENKTKESGSLQRSEVSVGGGGEIIYFRDSDDEKPDSDEDPDDDLDI